MATENIITVIPARGGSKGIPMKNISPLCGKPLLAYTIEAALLSGVCHNVYVSTDSEEIAKVASEHGVNVIDRPAEYSIDTASTESVLLHAIKKLRKERMDFDYILTLPPTSPLRHASTVKAFVEHFFAIADDYDAMLSLSENSGDFWIRNENGTFSRLFPGAPRRRQERAPLYLENSAIYITSVKALEESGSILGNSCTGFVISEEESIDINTPFDLTLAESLLKRETR